MVKLLPLFTVYYPTKSESMRKITVILPFLLIAALHSLAQTSVEIVPFGGYTFASRNDFYDYNTFGRIDGGFNAGASMRFNINRNVGIEVLYNHMNTFSNLYDYRYGNKIGGGNLGFDYIMIGPVHSFN